MLPTIPSSRCSSKFIERRGRRRRHHQWSVKDGPHRTVIIRRSSGVDRILAPNGILGGFRCGFISLSLLQSCYVFQTLNLAGEVASREIGFPLVSKDDVL